MKLLISLSMFIYLLLADGPELLLLKKYDPSVKVDDWLMSEKLDGVRAYWDGEQLISRSGRVFAAPKWFTEGFPPYALDGELWTKRGDFENIVSIVNTRTPHEGWHQIIYNVFEVPGADGGLMQRLGKLERYLNLNHAPYLHIISQTVVRNVRHLQNRLDEIVASGGEGIVVRDPAATYSTGRSNQALKVKTYEDDECIVTGYTSGQGKFTGMTGALECKWKGQVIKIGSGLKRNDRITPPFVGSEITFKYYGLTNNGKPKYPVFIRNREIK